MAKAKNSVTGDGYVGEIMVHRATGAAGTVEHVHARVGWAPEVTLKLKDGTLKKGRLTDFREARAAERKPFEA